MGVVTSIPTPIKIQLSQIQATKFEYVLDSSQYENNPIFIKKACKELSKNKTIQKVILKLFFPAPCKENLSKAIEKLLETKGTLIIYGKNLGFLNHPKLIKVWAGAKCSNLQLKFEINGPDYDYFLEGLSQNSCIKILGFRYLDEKQLKKLGEALARCPTIYLLQIILENRLYFVEDEENGIHSSKNPSTPQVSIPNSFLSQSRSITTYSIGGYQDRAAFIYGIVRSNSIRNLILENIDIEKFLRHDWNHSFKENSSIEEVKAIRGLNTISAMILFQSMRKNNIISSLQLEECVFFNHAYLGLEQLLKTSTSLKNLTLKNLLHLSINKFSQIGPLKNLCKILSGLTYNTSLLNLYIANHPASSNDIKAIEDPERTMSETFCNLFKNNSTLERINLEYFRLGPESFDGISEGLAQNKSLKSFCLKGNLMGWADLCKFLVSTKENTQLVFVDFCINKLLVDIQSINPQAFEEVFDCLAQSNLKTFTIEPWFWDFSAYPAHLFDKIIIPKQKYLI
jgi:hypothetical protein